MLRTFIAVRIPATASLRQLLTRIAAVGPKLRPVAADNLHVTLKFLGDTHDGQVPEITAAIQTSLAGKTACDVKLSGVGAFPNLHRPNVFWIGIQDNGFLADMVRSLDAALEPFGFAPEPRAFQPHLTVLRVKFRPPPEMFELAAEHASADFGTAHIDAVEYFQSELKPGGSQYTLLASVPLQAAHNQS